MSESKYCFIDLGGVRGKGKQAKISLEDKAAVSQTGWSMDASGYIEGNPYTTGGRRRWFLHRYIWFLQYGVILPPTTELDHIQNDPSNNARDNLRIASRSEQSGNKSLLSTNSSGCSHVFWVRELKKWRGIIKYNDRIVFRQSFDSIKEAANVTKAKHYEIYGEFSKCEIDPVKFAKSVKFDSDRKNNPDTEYNLAAPRTVIRESERFLPQLDGTCKIKLSDRKGGFVFTIIDQVDVDAAKGYFWHVDNRGYVVGSAKGVTKRLRKATQPTVRLARLIMARIKGTVETKYAGGPTTDHIDGSKLNNRRKNLREANAFQQAANTARRGTNTSGFKGISWAESQNKWRARVSNGRKREHLGYFSNKLDAVAAHAKRSKELHQEFARVGVDQTAMQYEDDTVRNDELSDEGDGDYTELSDREDSDDIQSSDEESEEHSDENADEYFYEHTESSIAISSANSNSSVRETRSSKYRKV